MGKDVNYEEFKAALERATQDAIAVQTLRSKLESNPAKLGDVLPRLLDEVKGLFADDENLYGVKLGAQQASILGIVATAKAVAIETDVTSEIATIHLGVADEPTVSIAQPVVTASGGEVMASAPEVFASTNKSNYRAMFNSMHLTDNDFLDGVDAVTGVGTPVSFLNLLDFEEFRDDFRHAISFAIRKEKDTLLANREGGLKPALSALTLSNVLKQVSKSLAANNGKAIIGGVANEPLCYLAYLTKSLSEILCIAIRNAPKVDCDVSKECATGSSCSTTTTGCEPCEVSAVVCKFPPSCSGHVIEIIEKIITKFGGSGLPEFLMHVLVAFVIDNGNPNILDQITFVRAHDHPNCGGDDQKISESPNKVYLYEAQSLQLEASCGERDVCIGAQDNLSHMHALLLDECGALSERVTVWRENREEPIYDSDTCKALNPYHVAGPIYPILPTACAAIPQWKTKSTLMLFVKKPHDAEIIVRYAKSISACGRPPICSPPVSNACVDLKYPPFCMAEDAAFGITEDSKIRGLDHPICPGHLEQLYDCRGDAHVLKKMREHYVYAHLEHMRQQLGALSKTKHQHQRKLESFDSNGKVVVKEDACKGQHATDQFDFIDMSLGAAYCNHLGKPLPGMGVGEMPMVVAAKDVMILGMDGFTYNLNLKLYREHNFTCNGVKKDSLYVHKYISVEITNLSAGASAEKFQNFDSLDKGQSFEAVLSICIPAGQKLKSKRQIFAPKLEWGASAVKDDLKIPYNGMTLHNADVACEFGEKKNGITYSHDGRTAFAGTSKLATSDLKGFAETIIASVPVGTPPLIKEYNDETKVATTVNLTVAPSFLYVYVPIKKSYDEHTKAARDLDGYLATFRNRHEFEDIQKLVEKGAEGADQVRLGARQKQSGDGWGVDNVEWQDGSEYALDTKNTELWGTKGQPDNFGGDETTLTMFGSSEEGRRTPFKLNDISADSKLHAIYQIPCGKNAQNFINHGAAGPYKYTSSGRVDRSGSSSTLKIKIGTHTATYTADTMPPSPGDDGWAMTEKWALEDLVGTMMADSSGMDIIREKTVEYFQVSAESMSLTAAADVARVGGPVDKAFQLGIEVTRTITYTFDTDLIERTAPMHFSIDKRKQNDLFKGIKALAVGVVCKVPSFSADLFLVAKNGPAKCLEEVRKCTILFDPKSGDLKNDDTKTKITDIYDKLVSEINKCVTVKIGDDDSVTVTQSGASYHLSPKAAKNENGVASLTIEGVSALLHNGLGFNQTKDENGVDVHKEFLLLPACEEDISLPGIEDTTLMTGEKEGTCHFFYGRVESQKSRSGHQTDAGNVGGKLAVILSATDQEAASSAMSHTHTNAWIGGTLGWDDVANGDGVLDRVLFSWYDDVAPTKPYNEVASYNNFKSDEPNNTIKGEENEVALEIYHSNNNKGAYKWNDEVAGAHRHALLEFELKGKTPEARTAEMHKKIADAAKEGVNIINSTRFKRSNCDSLSKVERWDMRKEVSDQVLPDGIICMGVPAKFSKSTAVFTAARNMYAVDSIARDVCSRTNHPELIISINPDNFPSEIGFSLIDPQGNVIEFLETQAKFDEDSFEVAEPFPIKMTVCLPGDGKYIFRITDSYGDGLSYTPIPGNFEITALDARGEQLFGSGLRTGPDRSRPDRPYSPDVAEIDKNGELQTYGSRGGETDFGLIEIPFMVTGTSTGIIQTKIPDQIIDTADNPDAKILVDDSESWSRVVASVETTESSPLTECAAQWTKEMAEQAKAHLTAIGGGSSFNSIKAENLSSSLAIAGLYAAGQNCALRRGTITRSVTVKRKAAHSVNGCFPLESGTAASDSTKIQELVNICKMGGVPASGAVKLVDLDALCSEAGFAETVAREWTTTTTATLPAFRAAMARDGPVFANNGDDEYFGVWLLTNGSWKKKTGIRHKTNGNAIKLSQLLAMLNNEVKQLHAVSIVAGKGTLGEYGCLLKLDENGHLSTDAHVAKAKHSEKTLTITETVRINTGGKTTITGTAKPKDVCGYNRDVLIKDAVLSNQVNVMSVKSQSSGYRWNTADKKICLQQEGATVLNQGEYQVQWAVKTIKQSQEETACSVALNNHAITKDFWSLVTDGTHPRFKPADAGKLMDRSRSGNSGDGNTPAKTTTSGYVQGVYVVNSVRYKMKFEGVGNSVTPSFQTKVAFTYEQPWKKGDGSAERWPAHVTSSDITVTAPVGELDVTTMPVAGRGLVELYKERAVKVLTISATFYNPTDLDNGGTTKNFPSLGADMANPGLDGWTRTLSIKVNDVKPEPASGSGKWEGSNGKLICINLTHDLKYKDKDCNDVTTTTGGIIGDDVGTYKILVIPKINIISHSGKAAVGIAEGCTTSADGKKGKTVHYALQASADSSQKIIFHAQKIDQAIARILKLDNGGKHCLGFESADAHKSAMNAAGSQIMDGHVPSVLYIKIEAARMARHGHKVVVEKYCYYYNNTLLNIPFLATPEQYGVAGGVALHHNMATPPFLTDDDNGPKTHPPAVAVGGGGSLAGIRADQWFFEVATNGEYVEVRGGLLKVGTDEGVESMPAALYVYGHVPTLEDDFVYGKGPSISRKRASTFLPASADVYKNLGELALYSMGTWYAPSDTHARQSLALRLHPADSKLKYSGDHSKSAYGNSAWAGVKESSNSIIIKMDKHVHRLHGTDLCYRTQIVGHYRERHIGQKTGSFKHNFHRWEHSQHHDSGFSSYGFNDKQVADVKRASSQAVACFGDEHDSIHPMHPLDICMYSFREHSLITVKDPSICVHLEEGKGKKLSDFTWGFIWKSGYSPKISLPNSRGKADYKPWAENILFSIEITVYTEDQWVTTPRTGSKVASSQPQRLGADIQGSLKNEWNKLVVSNGTGEADTPYYHMEATIVVADKRLSKVYMGELHASQLTYTVVDGKMLAKDEHGNTVDLPHSYSLHLDVHFSDPTAAKAFSDQLTTSLEGMTKHEAMTSDQWKHKDDKVSWTGATFKPLSFIGLTKGGGDHADPDYCAIQRPLIADETESNGSSHLRVMHKVAHLFQTDNDDPCPSHFTTDDALRMEFNAMLAKELKAAIDHLPPHYAVIVRAGVDKASVTGTTWGALQSNHARAVWSNQTAFPDQNDPTHDQDNNVFLNFIYAQTVDILSRLKYASKLYPDNVNTRAAQPGSNARRTELASQYEAAKLIAQQLDSYKTSSGTRWVSIVAVDLHDCIPGFNKNHYHSGAVRTLITLKFKERATLSGGTIKGHFGCIVDPQELTASYQNVIDNDGVVAKKTQTNTVTHKYGTLENKKKFTRNLSHNQVLVGRDGDCVERELHVQMMGAFGTDEYDGTPLAGLIDNLFASMPNAFDTAGGEWKNVHIVLAARLQRFQTLKKTSYHKITLCADAAPNAVAVIRDPEDDPVEYENGEYKFSSRGLRFALRNGLYDASFKITGIDTIKAADSEPDGDTKDATEVDKLPSDKKKKEEIYSITPADHGYKVKDSSGLVSQPHFAPDSKPLGPTTRPLENVYVLEKDPSIEDSDEYKEMLSLLAFDPYGLVMELKGHASDLLEQEDLTLQKVMDKFSPEKNPLVKSETNYTIEGAKKSLRDFIDHFEMVIGKRGTEGMNQLKVVMLSLVTGVHTLTEVSSKLRVVANVEKVRAVQAVGRFDATTRTVGPHAVVYSTATPPKNAMALIKSEAPRAPVYDITACFVMKDKDGNDLLSEDTTGQKYRLSKESPHIVRLARGCHPGALPSIDAAFVGQLARPTTYDLTAVETLLNKNVRYGSPEYFSLGYQAYLHGKIQIMSVNTAPGSDPEKVDGMKFSVTSNRSWDVGARIFVQSLGWGARPLAIDVTNAADVNAQIVTYWPTGPVDSGFGQYTVVYNLIYHPTRTPTWVKQVLSSVHTGESLESMGLTASQLSQGRNMIKAIEQKLALPYGYLWKHAYERDSDSTGTAIHRLVASIIAEIPKLDSESGASGNAQLKAAFLRKAGVNGLPAALLETQIAIAVLDSIRTQQRVQKMLEEVANSMYASSEEVTNAFTSKKWITESAMTPDQWKAWKDTIPDSDALAALSNAVDMLSPVFTTFFTNANPTEKGMTLIDIAHNAALDEKDNQSKRGGKIIVAAVLSSGDRGANRVATADEIATIVKTKLDGMLDEIKIKLDDTYDRADSAANVAEVSMNAALAAKKATDQITENVTQAVAEQLFGFVGEEAQLGLQSALKSLGTALANLVSSNGNGVSDEADAELTSKFEAIFENLLDAATGLNGLKEALDDLIALAGAVDSQEYIKAARDLYQELYPSEDDNTRYLDLGVWATLVSRLSPDAYQDGVGQPDDVEGSTRGLVNPAVLFQDYGFPQNKVPDGVSGTITFSIGGSTTRVNLGSLLLKTLGLSTETLSTDDAYSDAGITGTPWNDASTGKSSTTAATFSSFVKKVTETVKLVSRQALAYFADQTQTSATEIAKALANVVVDSGLPDKASLSSAARHVAEVYAPFMQYDITGGTGVFLLRAADGAEEDDNVVYYLPTAAVSDGRRNQADDDKTNDLDVGQPVVIRAGAGGAGAIQFGNSWTIDPDSVTAVDLGLAGFTNNTKSAFGKEGALLGFTYGGLGPISGPAEDHDSFTNVWYTYDTAYWYMRLAPATDATPLASTQTTSSDIVERVLGLRATQQIRAALNSTVESLNVVDGAPTTEEQLFTEAVYDELLKIVGVRDGNVSYEHQTEVTVEDNMATVTLQLDGEAEGSVPETIQVSLDYSVRPATLERVSAPSTM